MPNVPKHLKAAQRLAESKGWTIITNGGGHLTWISPNGTKVFTAKSPGGNRSHQNTVLKLRRAGLNIRGSGVGSPPKKKKAKAARDGRRSSGDKS